MQTSLVPSLTGRFLILSSWLVIVEVSLLMMFIFFTRTVPPAIVRVQDVDQPYKALDQDSADVSLGNLVSNESKEINFIFQAPTQTQVAGLWSPYFRFEFTVSHDKNLLASSGTVELLIRHGQLLLTKKGFSSVPAPSIPIQSQSAQYNDNAVQSPDSYSATQKHPPLSSYFTPMNPGTPETFWQGGSS